MIKRIEILLNIIHYCIYRVDYGRHLLSNKLNPLVLIGRIPAIKKKFQEQGTTHMEVVNKIWGDKRYGFSIMISGSGLVVALFVMILAVFDISNSLLKNPIKSAWLPFVLCMALAYLICHFSVFQRDKYISYFKQFETPRFCETQ